MAAVARRNLAAARASEAEAVTADSESRPLPAEPFDAVVAATAFHWIDPAVRMDRAADALRPGGALAVVSTQHVGGGTEDSGTSWNWRCRTSTGADAGSARSPGFGRTRRAGRRAGTAHRVTRLRRWSRARARVRATVPRCTPRIRAAWSRV